MGEVMKWYKITGNFGEAINGGNGVWHLPKGERPGEWMPKVARPDTCLRGYHVVEQRYISAWLPFAGGMLWEAEVRGKYSKNSDKRAYEQARLIKRVGVLDETAQLRALREMFVLLGEESFWARRARVLIDKYLSGRLSYLEWASAAKCNRPRKEAPPGTFQRRVEVAARCTDPYYALHVFNNSGSDKGIAVNRAIGRIIVKEARRRAKEMGL
jgi:hypothetical protein